MRRLSRSLAALTAVVMTVLVSASPSGIASNGIPHQEQFHFGFTIPPEAVATTGILLGGDASGNFVARTVYLPNVGFSTPTFDGTEADKDSPVPIAGCATVPPKITSCASEFHAPGPAGTQCCWIGLIGAARNFYGTGQASVYLYTDWFSYGVECTWGPDGGQTGTGFSEGVTSSGECHSLFESNKPACGGCWAVIGEQSAENDGALIHDAFVHVDT